MRNLFKGLTSPLNFTKEKLYLEEPIFAALWRISVGWKVEERSSPVVFFPKARQFRVFAGSYSFIVKFKNYHLTN